MRFGGRQASAAAALKLGMALATSALSQQVAELEELWGGNIASLIGEERCWEEGMQRPESEEDIFSFE